VLDLALGKPEAVQLLRRGFETRGWIFVELPSTIKEVTANLAKNAKAFFGTEDDYKQQFNHGAMFGYVTAKKKQSFRLLTGSMLSDVHGDSFLLPKEIASLVRQLGDEFDKTCTSIMEHTCKPVFNTTMDTLKERKLPLALKSPALQSAAGVKIGGYGMLDTVLYDMEPRTNGYPIVAEHTDPGLFSLTAGFTSPGLQMKDTPTGNWIDIGVDEAICWTGIEATELTDGDLEGGWHRVITVRV